MWKHWPEDSQEEKDRRTHELRQELSLCKRKLKEKDSEIDCVFTDECLIVRRERQKTAEAVEKKDKLIEKLQKRN